MELVKSRKGTTMQTAIDTMCTECTHDLCDGMIAVTYTRTTTRFDPRTGGHDATQYRSDGATHEWLCPICGTTVPEAVRNALLIAQADGVPCR